MHHATMSTVRITIRGTLAGLIGASLLGSVARTSCDAQQPAGENAAATTDANKGAGSGSGRGTGGGGGKGTGGGERGFGGTGTAKTSGTPKPLKLETISGEITRMDGGDSGSSNGKADSGTMAAARRPGPMLTLKTATETIQVHAGSPTFREEHGFALKVGDVIEVTGVRGQDAQQTFVAHALKRGPETLRLRDEQGNKLWKPRKRAEGPELSDITGKVVTVNAPATRAPGSGLGRATRFIVVRSGDEELAVEAGPENYIESNGLTLKAGDAVTVNGWRLPTARTGDRNIVLAASITKGETTVKVRDAKRHPLWKTEKK